MKKIAIKVLRPLMFEGERREAGEVLRVDPLSAAEMVGSTRAELADVCDTAAVNEAVEAENRRIMRGLGRAWPGHPNDGRWQTIGG